MDKKEKSINSHIDKAIGYSDKAHNELQIALNIALEGKGLSDYLPTENIVYLRSSREASKTTSQNQEVAILPAKDTFHIKLNGAELSAIRAD